jgi:gamma-glutamyltranspeptidase/glutathione hydrolase
MTVASEHALASEIGVAMMRAGGNAVDAAIATTIAVGTLNPYHSCIGGGGFAIVRDGRGEVQTIDFRVTAPVSRTELSRRESY